LGKFIDLTGKEFGRLKVIKRAENDKYGHSMWWCQCDCLGEDSLKIFKGDNLIRCVSKSCGCWRKDNARILFKKYNTYDLSSKFGIGYTSNTNIMFYFDLDDYSLIKNYCWFEDKDGYIVTHDDIRISMHRLVTSCPDDMEVDHEFHNRYDNRKEFLRIVTRSQNCMNMSLKSNNTSGVTGVCFSKSNEKWYAYIDKEGERINLGYYDNFNIAVKIRRQAEIEYFGEYRYMGEQLSSEKKLS
jgi:hypothetical protein